MKILSLSVLWFVALGCGSKAEAPVAEASAVAPVQTAPLEVRSLREEIVLYGTVVPGPESQHTASVPFESLVRRILVQVGQRVALGDALVEVEPSPDARLSLQQARAEAAAASETFSSVQARFSSRLATHTDVAAARREARDTELRVRSLVSRGAASRRTLSATGASVVTGIAVTEGALASAGTALVSLDLSERREVHFGIEAEDVSRAHPHLPIRVRDLSLPPRVEADTVVRAIGQSVNSATRLVDLYASLPDDAALLLGQRVVGTLAIESGPTMVVARSALVPQADRMLIYTVDASHLATSHAVRIGLENDVEVEVIASDLEAGMQVVVSGAAVLADGMHVAETSP